MDALIYNPLWFYLIAVNLYLFCLMGYDKYQAVKQGWRVPEANLLFKGAIGGGLGGLIAQRVFRHKTRKKQFYFYFAFGTVFAILLMVFFA